MAVQLTKVNTVHCVDVVLHMFVVTKCNIGPRTKKYVNHNVDCASLSKYVICVGVSRGYTDHHQG